MLNDEQRRRARSTLVGEQAVEAIAESANTSVDDVRAWIDEYLYEKASLGPETVSVGVRAGAEIIRDRRGIPHIYADDTRDLFHALGYAQAQDRLWQLDYLRRLAYGRLSEVFGPKTLADDRLARTLQISAICERSMQHLGEDSRLAMDAFADGVNDWMEQLPSGLPVEFEILGYEPEPWRAIDCLAIQRRWWWYLTGRLGVLYVPELVRAAVGSTALYNAFHRPDGELRYIVPAGNYDTEHGWPDAPLAEPARPPVSSVDQSVGSNNWAVGDERSANGSALLASDPHVYFSVPAEWYEAHLSGAGYDVAGLAYPATPALLFGRNRDIAWGLTNNICSLRDLYVEQINPSRPDEYRADESWRRMDEVTETIEVRGEASEELTVRMTGHGPVVDDLIPAAARPSVLWDDGEHGDSVLSLRWVGFETSDETQCMLDLNRARSVPEAAGALREWRCPTFNFGLSDRTGHIRYQSVGAIPVRGQQYRGYRRADDRHAEWLGYIPWDGMPSLDDPPRGWIASANNTTAPDDYPYPLSGTWTPDDRISRIESLLEAGEIHTIESFRRLQTDVHSARAERGVPGLINAVQDQDDARARSAIDQLREWDSHLRAESVGGTIYCVFFPRFHRRVLAERFTPDVVPLVAGAGWGMAELLLHHDPHGWFGSDRERVEAIRAAFRETLAWLTDQFGDDVSEWQWGKVHTLGVQHPAATTALQHDVLSLPPRPHDGGPATVAAAGYPDPQDLITRIGANYRLLVDLSDAGGTWTISYPGQSGQPGSPHFADQVSTYLANGYYRMPFTREEVDAEAESRTRLVPDG